jgi:NADH-quinone oxidoreductase subunit J
MNPFGFLFYLLAVIVLASTAIAISRRHVLHALVYLIISFIATGLIFYLLGAPFLALLEVIVYAGAIMVLFLFIVMMLRLTPQKAGWKAGVAQWTPALILGGISLAIAGFMVSVDQASHSLLPALTAKPLELGRLLFQKYWFAVEIASFLLLVALVGALYLGRQDGRQGKISTRGEL